MKNHRLWINGQWQDGHGQKEITFPFNGEKVAMAWQATDQQMKEAIEASVTAFHQFRKTSRLARSRLLTIMVREIQNKKNEFVQCLILEAGKPKVMSEIEVNRAIATFTLAAENAKTFSGEVIPLDTDAAGRAFLPAVSVFVPRGPILAITPFNFPLNLVAHKVAPALAVGAPVLLKPPPQAPGCSVLLAEIFEEAVAEVNQETGGGTSGNKDFVPLAALQVIHASNEVTSLAVKDPRMSVLSFTGSDKVGWWLQTQAQGKKTLLELGGNAAVIVHSDADLKRAAQRCANGGFSYAGQTCISVQRIYAQEGIYEKFLLALKDEMALIKTGDPRLDGVLVGPVIDEGAAQRISDWIEEAKKDGAQVFGGGRQGKLLQPAILTGVKKQHKLNCEEVFGPVVIVEKYQSFDEALSRVNESRFGLQAGVFTEDTRLIHRAFEILDVGGVIINEVSTYRADQMPYGGVKDSGLGREGVRYAMEDYCERKVLVQWKGF